MEHTEECPGNGNKLPTTSTKNDPCAVSAMMYTFARETVIMTMKEST